MKHILILADGLVAEEFVQSLNNKRIADNHYTVVIPRQLRLPEKLQVQMEPLPIDPTSYSKMRQLSTRTTLRRSSFSSTLWRRPESPSKTSAASTKRSGW